MGTRSGVSPEHWTRVQARAIDCTGTTSSGRGPDDVHCKGVPSHTSPDSAPGVANGLVVRRGRDNEEQNRMVGRQSRSSRDCIISTRRLLEERLSGWREAYEAPRHRFNTGRARDLVSALYRSAAAACPMRMPTRCQRVPVWDHRELVGRSIIAGVARSGAGIPVRTIHGGCVVSSSTRSRWTVALCRTQLTLCHQS